MVASVAGRADPLVDRRTLIAWELAGATVILLVGSFLHFAYELAGFEGPVAVIGSVNESTWEHLKLFFWPGLGYAITQHAYLRHRVNNFWLAHGVALWTTSVGVALAFYAYVGIVLPIYGKGTLAGTIVTAIVGIGLARLAAYRILRSPERGLTWARIGIAAIVLHAVLIVIWTYAPPHIFVFENFFGYRYTGDFGILPDYEAYRVFR